MTIAVGMGVFGLGCESFGKSQCSALVRIAETLTVQIIHDAETDEERAQMIQNYTRVVADLSALGCEYIPPPDAPKTE